jgi:hypothetical protein
MHSLRILLVAVCLSSVLAASAGCGAWRVFFPSHAHETVPPELPESLPAPAVLIFSKTNGFRHEEAIPAGLALFEEVAARRGWSLFHTENGATFSPEILSRFAVAVWHNASGDTLNEEQRAAFKDWLEQGGGFVGIHGAGGDPSYDWSWYVEELIGAQFIGHIMGPQFQDATLVIEDADHPVTASLPERFTHNEEWYSHGRPPDRLDPLRRPRPRPLLRPGPPTGRLYQPGTRPPPGERHRLDRPPPGPRLRMRGRSSRTRVASRGARGSAGKATGTLVARLPAGPAG